MKKYLLILLCFIPFIFAASIQDMHKAVIARRGAAAGADACAECPATGSDPGDLVCEDWDTTGSLCTWNTEEGNEDATHEAGNSCADKGSYTLEMTGAVGTLTTNRIDFASEQAELYVQIYFLIKSSAALAGPQTLIQFRNDAGGTVAYLLLDADEKLVFYHTDNGLTLNDCTPITVSKDTWHRLNFYWKGNTATDDGVSVKMDGGSELVDVGERDTVNDGWGRLYFFGPNLAGGDVLVWQIDSLKADDDTEPSACP